MQMVVADMSPGGRLKPAFGQRAAIEGNDIGQARVGYRHIRPQFGNGGVGAATLIDEHVDTLGDGVAEEPLAFAIDLGARNPGRVIAAARKLQNPSQVVQLLSRLSLVVAVEFHVNTDLCLIVECRQRGKRGRLLALAAKDIQGAGIEILNSGGMGQHGAHGIGKGHCLVLAVEKAAHAPYDRRCRLQGDLELGNDAECAARTDKEVDGVHIVRNEITRRVFGLGHGIAGKIQLERAAFRCHERQVACVSVRLTSMKLKQVAVRQCHVKPRNVRAHGAVGVTAGTRGIARRHAAQAGRCLGGIGGKELLRSCLELLIGLKRYLIPVSGRQCLLTQLLAQLRKHDARLHAQQKTASLVAAKTQVAIHTRSVEDVAAVGHGTGSQTGPSTLDRYRNMLGMELSQNGADFVLRCRKRDARRLARCARFIATIFFELDAEGFDGCRHANSPFS